jgi:superfamily II DNA or RNA helicase/HKD family nuclease
MPPITYGLYEQVINRIINENLIKIEDDLVEKNIEDIDSAESSQILAEYLARILGEVLDYIGDGENDLKERVDLCNSIIMYMAECIEKGNFGLKSDSILTKRIKNFLIEQDAKMLLALVDRRKQAGLHGVRPETSIAENSLFTGAAHEPSMASEIKKEILTCDRIDFLVSFIKWSGLRLIINELTQFTMAGGKLRVITTSYLGATDFKAVEQLSKLPNTEIRISYDTERTRLHAKTYIFWRDTGFSTVYIGSSNISESAMTSGLEWNIKLSEYDATSILEKIKATFEVYWNSSEFVRFILAIDAERLRKALKSERRSSQTEQNDFSFNFDIQPYFYQQEILDHLKAEREVHGFYKNLVVAATGTGKTVVAAFDYRNNCRANPNQRNRLLFVAHRKEILSQSLACFRGVLRELNFGAMMVGREKPDSLDHLFVSIQSFNSKDLIQLTDPEFYDYIIIDEFHHAAAPSYQELLEYYKPQILLGLTATPERADGRSVFSYFEGRIAAEIRLCEAIERKLLSPFHYFGVTDTVDLRKIRWVNSQYDDRELENLFVFEKAVAAKRVGYIIDAIERYCTDRAESIGIGFCVSKKHAEFMAEMFNKTGIPSEFLISDSDPEVRDGVKRRLVNKEINFVFVVDIYNEGVDIPEVNTVLFLRPTESLTVFLQQLGRGLRLCDGKEALTVLDFVGHAHNKYSFGDRFKTLLSRTRRTVEYEIKHGFANVPRGCSIQLEKQAQEYILENIKNSINNKRNILYKLQDWLEINHELRVSDFFEHYHVSPQDVYTKKATVTGLAVQSGLIEGYSIEPEREKLISAAFGRLSLANSRRWLQFLLTVLPRLKENGGTLKSKLNSVEQTMLVMLYYTIWGKGLDELEGGFKSIEAAIYWAIEDPMIYCEFLDLLNYQYEKIDFTDKSFDDLGFECALDLYCSYTLDQILVAFGKHTESKKSAFREGVLYIPEKNLDVFFVTLNKSEKDYSPSTMYNDYSINDELFHWQSQSRTTDDSPTGQRYIRQRETGSKVLFFVREYKKDLGLTSPFTCLGLADYDSHYGSAPISIRWRLKEPMPGFIVRKAMKV